MMPNDKVMIADHVSDSLGSSVHQVNVHKGMNSDISYFEEVLDIFGPGVVNSTSKTLSYERNTYAAGGSYKSKLVDSLDYSFDGAKGGSKIAAKDDVHTMGLHGRMGAASSMEINGESLTHVFDSPNNEVPTLSLSLMESSPIIPAQPTLEDIIAFGGIPKASTVVRSSSRLESRPDVDMTQMEKAMRNT
jgi:hypothetical protein